MPRQSTHEAAGNDKRPCRGGADAAAAGGAGAATRGADALAAAFGREAPGIRARGILKRVVIP